MKTATITKRQAMDAGGSEMTDGEAEALAEILGESGYTDTRDIPDGEWTQMMDRAIAMAQNGGAR